MDAMPAPDLALRRPRPMVPSRAPGVVAALPAEEGPSRTRRADRMARWADETDR
jgi:hypothetical protein